MLLGDVILVSVTEVGSVACVVGWVAACAVYLALGRRKSEVIKFSAGDAMVASFGLVVAIVLAFMKIIPMIPGHFTRYEWVALAAWGVLGALATAVKSSPRK